MKLSEFIARGADRWRCRLALVTHAPSLRRRAASTSCSSRRAPRAQREAQGQRGARSEVPRASATSRPRCSPRRVPTLAEQQRRSAALSRRFDANEKKLTELQAQLDARAGNLGEMFGVVRQVANDFSSVVHNSLISAQYPGSRRVRRRSWRRSKSLPSMQELERFWFELQREMTETGSVVQFKTKIVTPKARRSRRPWSRIGPFIAMTDGRYLNYLPSQQQLAVMARQPGARVRGRRASRCEDREGRLRRGGRRSDARRAALDLRAASERRWSASRRAKSSATSSCSSASSAWCSRSISSSTSCTVRGKVRNQLQFPNDPVPDNPLGRVLATFKGDAETLEEDAEVVELRISEAVLKEVPKLERFQSFLRLAVAAGPLLGLIGTVVGMIITFQSITESGSSDPKLMAERYLAGDDRDGARPRHRDPAAVRERVALVDVAVDRADPRRAEHRPARRAPGGESASA